MNVELLILENFRNYKHLVLRSDLLNIIFGKNAQGKTSLIEAVFFGITGHSCRTEKEKEVIRWGDNCARLYLELRESCRKLAVEVNLSENQQKKVKVNGVLVRGYPLGWVGAVLFSPEDIAVVQGPPNERRRFIDREWGPLLPHYEHNLHQYNRLVLQKNNLLRELREKKLRTDVDVWNQQLCYFGARVLLMRLALLKKMNPLIRYFYNKLTNNREELVIRYNSSLKIGDEISEKEFYDRFLYETAALKDEEIARGQTLLGPHRDDISFLINGMDARIYGSRGQQYTILLALKMAQVEQWKRECKENPVLLLDDILFDLDADRRDVLLSFVEGNVQTFITAIDDRALDFYKLSNSKVFVIDGGSIENFQNRD